ncbi:hypothetical protein TNCV_1608961 [Trichonephila clavipes]|nr:hypothetical protein TNCV_1608961 [Trichonephila clavipes]
MVGFRRSSIGDPVLTHNNSLCGGISDGSNEFCDGDLSRLLTNPLGESVGPEWHYFNPTFSRRNRDMQISEKIYTGAVAFAS